LFVFGGIAAFVVSAVRYSNRLKFIEEYEWPPGLLKRLSSHYPNLTVAEKTKVGDGLKQFFRAYLKSGRRYVAMPSVVADDLWHEHILYTKEYHRFCDKAFGRYLHHTPAVVLRKQQRADNEGLRRVWTHACREEGIDYKSPKRLPLIFALDTLLNIPGGYRYAPDCRELRDGSSAGTQCGGDMGSSSYDGGTSGLGDGDGGSGSWGDGGGDGGGCGGGGD
jgi:hypothetical protein